MVVAHPASGALGANFLRQLGLPHYVTILVAQHSVARHEAALLDKEAQLSPFPYQPDFDLDLLSYLDGTTGPNGATMTLGERLQDIVARYGDQSWQAKVFRQTLPEMRLVKAAAITTSTAQYP